MILTEISPVAGANGDGVVLGSVNETLLTAAYTNAVFSTTRVVYRLDRTAGSLNIVDDTANAISGTTNAFSPWGNNVIPNSAVLRIFDSIDGVWASNPLTLAEGGIASFKTLGWNRVVFGENASRQNWRPSPDPASNILSKKYIRVELDDGSDKDSFIFSCGNTDLIALLVNVTTVGSPTAATKLSEMIIVRIPSDYKWVNLTSDLNGSLITAPADKQHFPYPDTEHRWAFSNPAYGMELYIHRAEANSASATDVHEYLASDGTWKPLAGWSNASNDFTSGPAAISNTPDKFPVRWNVPSDWASMPLTVTLEDNTTGTVSAYWIRERYTAVASYGRENAALYRARARQFGNSNASGFEQRSVTTIKGIALISASVSNTTTAECQLSNLSTGASVAFTIPANPTFPLNIDTADLVLQAGERLGLICNSGGTLTGVQLEVLL